MTDSWNRFHTFSRRQAVIALALLLAWMAYGVISVTSKVTISGGNLSETPAAASYSDQALYQHIIHRMERGENYYSAVVAEHRSHNYPLRPFVTVRVPVLAWVGSLIGVYGLVAVNIALASAAALLWFRRLERDATLPNWARFGVVFVALNLGQATKYDWAVVHEVPAGLLIAIGLALYHEKRQWATFACVAAALALRETVLPIAALFGIFALAERNWRMVIAWATLGGLFGIGILIHAQLINAVTVASDLTSPGWNAREGWPGYISFVTQCSIFRPLPLWIMAIVVPLALLGWSAWRSRLANVVLTIQCVFACVTMIFARAENFYWAMLIIPTLFVGLTFAPSAVRTLISKAALPSVKPMGTT